MSELVAPAPEHCPGTDSEAAGKASACQGCPNQEICASALPKGPDPDVAVIAQRLAKVKRKILVLSGKGGVGKSTVTSMLARCLASRNLNVGVLDVDICGPSLPRIFGVEGEQIHQSGSGWSPVYVDDSLSLMSAGFLLPSLDAAVIWRGPKKNGLIKQCISKGFVKILQLRMASRFAIVESGAPIEVLEMGKRFREDPNHEKKVNLSVGGFADDGGHGGHDFKVVKKIELELAQDENLSHGYLPALGYPEVNSAAMKLLFGSEHRIICEQKAFCAQSIGGTGPLRVAAEFLKNNLGYSKAYYSNQTWMNHRDIFERAGFDVVQPYPYWNTLTSRLDLAAMKNHLEKVDENSVIILHASAHNPTGIDPSKEEWKEICEIMKRRNLMPVFDCAYQGFATGDLDEDAWAVRYFADQDLEMLVSQSFGKNMSLYGERIGFLTGVSSNASNIPPILSQLTIIVRAMYSNPSGHGAHIVGKVLTNPTLYKEWTTELKQIAEILRQRRIRLRAILEEKVPSKDWCGITRQIGMFYFSGLTFEQGIRLQEKHHVYMLPSSGRINLGTLTSDKIEYVGNAIAEVVSQS